MDPEGTGQPPLPAVDVLLEVLEACLHQLLHSRMVYPSEIFERRLLHGVPVFMSRHPELNKYIFTVLANAKPLLLAGTMERLECRILAPQGTAPIENYVFQMSSSNVEDGAADQLDRRLREAEISLRDLLVRVGTLGTRPRLPEGATFQLALKGRESNSQGSALQGALRQGDWLVEDQPPQATSVLPLKTVPLPSLSLQFSLEAFE
mmetsp:Transcript_15019/g.44517  ORF Transcript_15019/g.44517 Transcript_15019/m.44517 type:complete len:206 (-) Transcript_15019:65-682(-)